MTIEVADHQQHCTSRRNWLRERRIVRWLASEPAAAGDLEQSLMDSNFLSQTPELVVSNRRLGELCDRWSEQEQLALDTEFIRTRTFYPRLGLVQVADQDGGYLLDAVEIDDWSPFAGVLADSRVLKVLHSPSEDLELSLHCFEVAIDPVVDTQLAATLAGVGPMMGYQRLVAAMFDLDLPKEQQRSDWLKRPLSASQVRYAWLDVALLLPLWEQLRERLELADRVSWVEQDCARLADDIAQRLDPRTQFNRLFKASLGERQTRVLWGLVSFREEQARQRDLPRGFVLKDECLVRIARDLPTTRRELQQIPGLGHGSLRRYGEKLLRIVEDPPGLEQPPPSKRRLGSQSRKLVDVMRERVRTCAEELGVPPEVLASRRTLEALVRQGSLPTELQGWRREVVGDDLMSLMNGSVTGNEL